MNVVKKCSVYEVKEKAETVYLRPDNVAGSLCTSAFDSKRHCWPAYGLFRVWVFVKEHSSVADRYSPEFTVADPQRSTQP